MKNIFLSFFLISICSASGYGQQSKRTNSSFSQAITIKPTNFSNIDLGQMDDIAFMGYHVGLAYERLFRPDSHWSWVLPITFAFYNPLPVTDYDKHGHQLYFTPGVKYYLKTGNPRKGWSASVNLLAGLDKYDYSSRMRWGNAQLAFYGVLGTWLYNAPISKTAAFNFELGFGLKNTHYQSDYKEQWDFPPYDYINSIDKWYLSGIMNVSVGISKWF